MKILMRKMKEMDNDMNKIFEIVRNGNAITKYIGIMIIILAILGMRELAQIVYGMM